MKEKLDFLSIQTHINRNYKRWLKKYDNIEGIHIGEKSVNNKLQKNNFSIVFHVNRKKEKTKKKIPKYFFIKSISGKLKISSDVIETGKLILNNIQIGDVTKSAIHNSFGTISNYFTTSKGVYLGSNMHVLAPNMIEQGIKNYNIKNGGNFEILLYNNEIIISAILYASIFKGIDFGFARINNPDFIDNKIKGDIKISGVFTYDRNNYKNVKLYFYGVTSGLKECVLKDIFVTKNYDDTQFNNLLRLNYCSRNGDSGAPLFDEKKRLVGFILGGNSVEQASYALSINDILTYFQSLNL